MEKRHALDPSQAGSRLKMGPAERTEAEKYADNNQHLQLVLSFTESLINCGVLWYQVRGQRWVPALEKVFSHRLSPLLTAQSLEVPGWRKMYNSVREMKFTTPRMLRILQDK